MDLSLLAETAVRLLAPALPAILGLGGNAVETAKVRVGEQGIEKAEELWARLHKKHGRAPGLERSAASLAASPDDPRRQGALLNRIEDLLESDPELREWVTELLGSGEVRTILAHQAHVVGAGAVVQGGVGAGAGGLASRELHVHGNLTIVNLQAAPPREFLEHLGLSRPAPDLTAATGAYLELVVERCRYLDFRGMGMADRVALRLPLLDMYIPLQGRMALPEGETWERADRDLKLAGRDLTPEEAAALGREAAGPRPLLDRLRGHSLVLLGDPGAGKTTFLKYLALSLALGQGQQLGLGARLPVLLPLSAYAAALAAGDVSLADFVPRYFAAQGVTLPVADLLAAALDQGAVLFLLDGLDEVRDRARRHLVGRRLAEFYTFHRRSGNRFVFTSRIVGYREVRLAEEGLAECTLVDFDDREIEAFVERWTVAVERVAQGDSAFATQSARRERDELLAATRGNPGIRRLATNPLLLTILALMKRQGVALPERRVELYQKYVETLLRHWNLARGLEGRPARELDLVETLKVLAPLALWMQETSPGHGLVREGDLLRELERLYRERSDPDPEGAAQRFLADVRDHASLLLDRGGRQFGFIHLTFQEYLAAVALGRLAQQSVLPVVDALVLRFGEPTWREVALLAVGYLGIVQQRDGAASKVLEELLRRAPGEPGEPEAFAGEAVADVWPGGVTPECRERVLAALQAAMGDARVSARWRAAAGDALARVGDPRPAVMTVDGMEFCWVPAGRFLMGSPDGDDDAYPDECPAGEVELPYGYWLGRYPVTVAQFREYCETAGVEPGNPNCLRDPKNRPVVWVSWDEAVAFCGWLAERWRHAGWLYEGWVVALPSEAEWEKAARGGLELPRVQLRRRPSQGLVDGCGCLVENEYPARKYPWGDLFDPALANTGESQVGSTSAVGCFCAGGSPYGVEELSGNCFEWTRSLQGGYPYPVSGQERADRENLNLRRPRVVRGGSFFGGSDMAGRRRAPRRVRCAYRDGDLRRNRNDGLGFRVVVLPPFFSGL